MSCPCDVCVNAAGGCGGTQLDRIFSKLILDPITLLLNCDDNVGRLKANLVTLDARRKSVQHEVDEAQRRAEEIEQEVTIWMAKADEYITGQSKMFLDELEGKAKKRCFMGLCPNPVARYKLSKKAKEDANGVDQLAQQPSQFIRISFFPYDQSEQVAVAAADDGLPDFDSRSKVLEEIMNLLKDPGIKRIGLHGMPGVGKTTMAKEVKRRAQREELLFDAVVFAEVKKTQDLGKIQAEIARDLNLVLPNEREFRKAAALERKMRRKKVLVILDDIWRPPNLKAIGIPLDNTELKILATSRELDVLSHEMNSDRNIEVGQLENVEARKLFEETVGADLRTPALRKIANEIVKRCGGLPLAIVTVGRALKGRESHVWRDARQRLTNPSPGNFKGISAEVYSAIEFSYRHLEDYGLQETLLLCSFLGHGASIELLVKYAVGLRLFDDVDTIQATRDRVFTLVSKLRNSALLLDVQSNSMFGIHDLVRDVALAIAYKDNYGIILADRKRLDLKALEAYKWVDFNGEDIDDVHIGVECPQLNLFILDCKNIKTEARQMQTLEASFFKGMRNLKVLALEHCYLSFQPPFPISLLENLRLLCLWNVMLNNATIIGELQSLEVLCIGNLDIEVLPLEVGKLTRLKLLDLCDCYNLKVIPPNVLSNLSRLEELYLPCNILPWKLEENGNQTNASLSELAHLHNLTALEVCIQDVRIIPVDLFSRLERYMIYTGKCPRDIWRSSLESSRVLKLEMNEGSSFDPSIRTLFKKAEMLCLENLEVENAVHELDSEGFQELKHVRIKNAPYVQCFVNSKDQVGCNAFPMLEVLDLHELTSLEKIYRGQLGATTFSKLRTITVEYCHQLENLFLLSATGQLLQLQEIEVKHCNEMGKIVDEEGQGDVIEHVELGQLRSLRLEGLPKLISFSHGKNSSLIDDPSSSGIPLFDNKVVFPNLEELVLSGMQIAMIHNTSARPCSISNLTELCIYGCDNLEHLFSFSMAIGLVKLRQLNIRKCKNLTVIIATENAEDFGDLSFSLQWSSLEMVDLQNIVAFCSGNHIIEFSFMKQLFIENCPKLKGFPFKSMSTDSIHPHFNEQLKLPVLDNVKLDSNRIQQVWQNQPPTVSFSVQNLKLTKLSVVGCTVDMKYLFTRSVVKSFVLLKELVIDDCKMLKAVIGADEESTCEVLFPELQRSTCEVLFPELKRLYLANLPKLITFYMEFTSNCDSKVQLYDSQALPTIQSTSGETVATKLMFPDVTDLTFSALPNFKSFCLQTHITEWPSLTSIAVSRCNKVQIFASEFPILERRPCLGGLTEPAFKLREKPFSKKRDHPVESRLHGDNQLKSQTEHPIPMFWVNPVTFQSLEKLELRNNDIMKEVWRGQYPKKHFPKLKVVLLSNFLEQLDVFPSFFIQSLPNLELLSVSDAFFDEIFQGEGFGGEVKPEYVPTQLCELRLFKLHQLAHLWNKKSLESVFFSLRTLVIMECSTLKNLVPSFITFENLQILEVTCCDGLINLVGHSTAESLTGLTKMAITKSGMVKEIIELDDDVKDGIVFSKLNCLELRGLPSLSSFCSVKCNFEFPSLDKIIVEDCPNLEIFSSGQLSTPGLREVILRTKYGDEGHWNGNLHTTIPQWFLEQKRLEAEHHA